MRRDDDAREGRGKGRRWEIGQRLAPLHYSQCHAQD